MSTGGLCCTDIAPGFDQNPGLLQHAEDLAIEKFIPQAGIEALDIAVLPGTPWRDISCLGAHGSDLRLDSLGDEFWPIARYERVGRAELAGHAG